MKRRKFIKSVTALSAGMGLSNLVLGAAKAGDTQSYKKCDVAVIGAGISGLVAARELTKKGYTVKVVEANNRVGGRTQNQHSIRGVTIDGGGQWMGPTQTELLALASELGVSTFKSWNTGAALNLLQGQVFFDSDIPADPASDLEYQQIVKMIDDLALTVPLDAPWAAPDATILDSQRLGAWLDQKMTPGSSARERIELGIAAIQGVPSTNISLLWFLFFVHSGGGWNMLQSMEGGAQESRFVGGSQLLSDKMVADLGDHIVLGNPVSCIEQEHEEVSIELRYGKLKAQRVIIAMTPADANKMTYDPKLPPMRQQLHANWNTASGVKVHAIYPKPFWREAGLSGQAYTDTAVGTINDNSPEDASFGVLLGFIGPELLLVDPVQRRLEVLKVFATLFGDEAASPLDYLEKDWNKETYIAGCESPLGVGVLTTYGQSIRAPAGLIHWAGTETAIQWNGYMEGAVRAGKRAAQEVIATL